MNNPVFSGTTAECSEHFFANNDWLLARACLSEFIKTDGQTVRQWYTGKQLPVGMGLLRFRVFLDLLGYEVEEFNLLPDVTKDFGRLMAFGYISHAEALKMMGYANDKGLFDIVIRAKSPQKQRVYRIERFVEDSTEVLEVLTQQFKKQIRDGLRLGDEPEVQAETPVPTELNLSGYVSLGDPLVAAVLTTISSAEAVISMLDWNAQADELVAEIAKRVDYADLTSLIASLESIRTVVVHGSSESQ